MSRIWSALQLAVFDDVANGSGHTMLNAVAGSGKSTTIRASLAYVPSHERVLCVAFNKAIVTELTAKLAEEGITNASVLTLHSLGLRACSKGLGRPEIDDQKMQKIVAAMLDLENHGERYEWAGSVVKAASLVKCYLARTDAEMQDVVDMHEIVPPKNDDERVDFLADVREAINRSIDLAHGACPLCDAAYGGSPCPSCGGRSSCAAPGTIDFDDMIFLPHALKLEVPQFDRVFVDETQDMNAGQIALVLRAVKPSGRITAVGDPRQSIYGFRGACADSFDRVRLALNAKVLPLSVSYRCSKAVVLEAKTIVPHIEHAPDAVEGRVERVLTDRMMKEAVPGDFVLSRTNAPLLPLCIAFLKAGRAAAIQGRDIGGKLASTIRRIAKSDDVDAMLLELDAYTAREIKRLTARGRDTASLADLGECVHALAEGETSVRAVISKIESLFADGDSSARITLSSTHKAKGMERDRVWLLRPTYCKRASTEESNLLYVAITRAKVVLFVVTDTFDAPPK